MFDVLHSLDKQGAGGVCDDAEKVEEMPGKKKKGASDAAVPKQMRCSKLSTEAGWKI